MAMIKDWFENKLVEQLNLPRLYHLSICYGIKETEKAVYAMFYTDYTSSGITAKSRCAWIPKSAIEDIESLEFIPDYDTALAKFHIEYDM